ncbi:MAG: TonB-dependent receptor, partial [Pricia sp.]
MNKKVNSLISLLIGQTNNIFLIGMRVSVVLLCVGLTSVFAHTSNAQRIDVELEEVPITTFFEEIQEKSGFVILYRDEVIAGTEKVTVNADNTQLETVLTNVLTPLGLGYEIINRQIVVNRNERSRDGTLANTIKSPLQQTVNGTVSDAQGAPLPGANIVEKGTTNGTQTDFNGNFSLDVADDAVLVVSYIGFATKEVNVDGQSDIAISLAEDAAGLDEVVVVGYGTQRKGDLTGSSVGIDSDEISSLPANSFEQSISGKVSGVQVTQSNGAPGGGISFKIRGANSITGNSEPLYVIDGVPIISDNANSNPGVISSRGEGQVNNGQNALSTLNPNDIENIQVLKDASATAIYGARGANGVVLITTKKGQPGKPTVNIDMYAGLQSPTNRLDLVNPQDYVTALREGFENADEPFPLTEQRLDELLQNPTPDPQDIALRAAPLRNLQLSVSGASENDLNYYLSVNNFEQQGIIKNSGFERNSLRLNLEKGFNKLRVGANLSLSRTDSDIVIGGNRTSTLALISGTGPLQPQFDENGDYLHTTVIDNGNSVSLQSLLDGASDNLVSDRFLGSVFAEYTIIDPLTFKSTLGLDVDKRERNTYYSRITGPRFGGTSNPGFGQQATVNSTQLVSTNTLTYEPQLSEDHRMTVTGVYEAQTFERASLGVVNRGFTSDILGADAIGSGQQPGGPEVSNSRFKWQLSSWVGRVFYGYKNKYLLNATVRYDGSSRFGENNRWGTFPSIGLGWNVSEENFLNDWEALNQFKIRGSYGITGNQEIGVLRTAERYVPTGGTIFGDVVANTVNAVSFANPNLKWEESAQLNVGLDASFLNSRLNFTFDYYNRTTSDLLLEVNIAPSSGFSSNAPIFNAGEIENRGIELALDAAILESEDLQWNVSANFSRNRNEVLEILSERTFGEPVDGNTVPGSLIEEGRPIGVFYGYKTDGVYATQAEADADVTDGSVFLKEAGEYRYVDVNGDNEITSEDRTVVGDPNP